MIDSVARIAVGFNMRLRRNVAISGRTFMELGAFHQVLVYNVRYINIIHVYK